jgi:hypothetical protein
VRWNFETLADFLDAMLRPGCLLRASLDGEGSHTFQINIATAAQGQFERGQSFPVERVYPSPRWSSKRPQIGTVLRQPTSKRVRAFSNRVFWRQGKVDSVE